MSKDGPRPMATWTAQRNDLVGGWIVTTYPYPLSEHDTRPSSDPGKRGRIIAECTTADDAKLIAELLNRKGSRQGEQPIH